MSAVTLTAGQFEMTRSVQHMSILAKNIIIALVGESHFGNWQSIPPNQVASSSMLTVLQRMFTNHE